jgi:hypothetical protein
MLDGNALRVPIILMYAYEMRRILAEPKGAAAWGSMLFEVECSSESLKGWAGR